MLPELLPHPVDGFHEVGDCEESVGARGTAQICNGDGLKVKVEAAGIEARYCLVCYRLCQEYRLLLHHPKHKNLEQKT